MTFRVKTLRIMTLSMITLSMITLRLIKKHNDGHYRFIKLDIMIYSKLTEIENSA
jgi:hypothetical protein